MQLNNISKQIKIKNYSNMFSDYELQTFLSFLPKLHKDIKIKLYILDNEKQFLFHELLFGEISISNLKHVLLLEAQGSTQSNNNKACIYVFNHTEMYHRYYYKISLIYTIFHEIYHQIYFQNKKMNDKKYKYDRNNERYIAEKEANDFTQDIITRNSEKLFQMYKGKHKKINNKDDIEYIARILNPYRD